MMKVLALENILKECGIPLNEWGAGSAKTLSHLHAEIEEGETILAIGKDGPIRQLSVMHIDVYCVVDDAVYKLKESHQTFSDGRKRERKLNGSLGEKCINGDHSPCAARRALSEELDVTRLLYLEPSKDFFEKIESPSYPGLMTEYKNYQYQSVLHSDEFKPDGYVEEQGDKTTYFVWERVLVYPPFVSDCQKKV